MIARTVLGLAACVVLLGGIAGSLAVVPSASALVNCDTASDALDSAEMEMLQLVNGARAAEGVAPLGVSPNLNRAAAWKSEDEGSNGTYGFDHTDSLGRSPFVRAQDCGYPAGAGENIAYGFPGARATFDAFMSSPGHRANILNTGYLVIGIGRSGSAWALNFGFVDDSGEPAPPPASPTATPSPAAAPSLVATATPTPIPSPVARQQPAAPIATPARASPSPAPTVAPPTPAVSAPAQRQGGSMALPAGTSLVAFSGPAMAVGHATRSLGGSLAGIYWWDAAGGRWLRYFPGGPSYANTLAGLQPGELYYISLTAAATWAY